jgi:hypothetical protein
MITQEKINRGGSKLEITRALIEAGLDNEIPVPRSTYKYFGQSLDSILPEFHRMKKPVIVRGSHPNDYHGFIDVIPTKRDVTKISELEEAVREIEQTAESEDVKVHCEDWNQPYSKEVHVLIQEQGSSIVGSMLRHPNDKNQLRIEYFDIIDNINREPNSYASFDELGLSHISNIEISDNKISELMEMYKKLEKSGIIDTEWSHQVEFGLRPLMFYQARPFKKFQPKGDFSISYLHIPFGKIIRSEDCFGITPSEGIDLEFYFRDCHEFSPIFGAGLPLNRSYGLAITAKSRQSFSLGCKIGDIKVFCSPCLRNHYLSHFNYRFMKKAEISLISGLHYSNCYGKFNSEDFKEARVFADGKNGVVIPRKYFG